MVYVCDDWLTSECSFFAKLVQNLTNWELRFLIGIGLVWNFVSIYCVKDIGFTFPFSGWILGECALYFVLGYAVDRIVTEKMKIKLYGLGILGYLISVLGRIYVPNFENATDLSVGFVGFTIACYLFMQKYFKCSNEHVCKCVSFVAKHSFFAYMIHIAIFNKVSNVFVPYISIHDYLLCIGATFALSYIVSIFFTQIVIRPIQALCFKIMG